MLLAAAAGWWPTCSQRCTAVFAATAGAALLAAGRLPLQYATVTPRRDPTPSLLRSSPVCSAGQVNDGRALLQPAGVASNGAHQPEPCCAAPQHWMPGICPLLACPSMKPMLPPPFALPVVPPVPSPVPQPVSPGAAHTGGGTGSTTGGASGGGSKGFIAGPAGRWRMSCRECPETARLWRVSPLIFPSHGAPLLGAQLAASSAHTFVAFRTRCWLQESPGINQCQPLARAPLLPSSLLPSSLLPLQSLRLLTCCRLFQLTQSPSLPCLLPCWCAAADSQPAPDALHCCWRCTVSLLRQGAARQMQHTPRKIYWCIWLQRSSGEGKKRGQVDEQCWKDKATLWTRACDSAKIGERIAIRDA